MLRTGVGRFIALCAVCWCVVYARPLGAQAATQYVLLIDTSGSMVGLPSGSGNAVIFPQVKDELVRYLRSLRPGDIVDVRTFDRGLHRGVLFRIESEEDSERAIAHVRGLGAEGRETWVYQSILETARGKLEEARRRDAPEIPTIFYVFTDGLDNDPRGLSMREMLRQYADLRQEKDFLIYVTLGVDLPPEDVRALDEFPHARHHREARDMVRIGTVQVRARRLDFGFVEGESSASRSLALQPNNLEPSEILLRLEPRFPEIEAAGGVVEVEPSTVDLESSQRIRLKIINRESLPARDYQGEIHLSSGQPHVQIVPDRVEVALSTLPGPTATVSLPGSTPRLDFGERIVGEGEMPELTARVEFNAGALEQEGGFYVTVVPGRKGAPAPVATWSGEPVGDRRLTSRERFGELVLSWPETPDRPETLTGEVHFLADRLALEGEALLPGSEEGSYAVPYSFTVKEPPPPAWLRWLVVLAALPAMLFVLAVLYWIFARKSPWAALRLWLLRTGMAKPRLYGKLVYEVPGGERMELALSGTEPILLGAGTERWETLPDQIEISPRLRKDTEIVIARSRQGQVSYRSKDSLGAEPLSGQALNHNDTLILSDGGELVFSAFGRK